RKQQIMAHVHEPEIFRNHANDLAGGAIDHDAASDDFGIAAESALPVSIPEHDDERAFVVVVFLHEFTAKNRPYAEHRKQAEGDPDSIYAFGIGELGDRDGLAVPEGYVGESV